MKIKRFSAKTMRQALRQVREEQGPDAVILSNRSVDGGVEVVAAVDYDESLITGAGAVPAPARRDATPAASRFGDHEPVAPPASGRPEPLRATAASGSFDAFLRAADTASPTPGATDLDLASDPTVAALREEVSAMRSLLEEQVSALVWDKQARQNPQRARLLRRLAVLDVEPDVARTVAQQALEHHAPDTANTRILNILADCLPVAQDDVCERGGVYAVVGPTGVGKTTSIAKIAARCALTHGRDALALVSTDSFRIGAQEQLATFAQILDVPVHMARDAGELARVLRGLAGKRLVLVDTAGVSQRDETLVSNLDLLRTEGVELKRLLALPANVQGQTLHDVITRFGQQPLHGAIVTKLDEAASFGGVFSNLIRHGLPTMYLTDGQRVPEDLHWARGKALWWVREAARRVQQAGRRTEEVAMASTYSEETAHAHA